MQQLGLGLGGAERVREGGGGRREWERGRGRRRERGRERVCRFGPYPLARKFGCAHTRVHTLSRLLGSWIQFLQTVSSVQEEATLPEEGMQAGDRSNPSSHFSTTDRHSKAAFQYGQIDRGIEMTEREKESEVEVWEKGGREGYEGE